MKKIVMVVMMVMAIATGCRNNVKEVGKVDSVVENLMTHHKTSMIHDNGDTVTIYTKVYTYKNGETIVVDEYEETYTREEYLEMRGTDV